MHVFSVRGRPVGFRSSRFGGELVATERGHFPVSPTGYRSLSGICGGEPASHDLVSAEFLEALAAERDREHQQLLKQLREGVKPVGQPVANYVHVSGAFEQAVQNGFFATDRERAALWSGAHQILCLVDTDPRFQPVPHPCYPAWHAKHCAASLAWARSLLSLLKTIATGDLPERLPARLMGPSEYLRLPPKPGGEPRIELGGFVAEMALNVPAPEEINPRPRSRTAALRKENTTVEAATQLGLFESESVATRAVAAAGPRPHL